MKRPITTLFMLESLDGKISTGSNDSLDVDKDYPKACLMIQAFLISDRDHTRL